MIIRALLPKLIPKTVKEKVIVILSTDFPLTIRELKARIKKNFNQSVSYQSVHKELNRLMKEEIIVYKSKRYLLNVEWIRQVGLFSDLILSNYTEQRKHSVSKLLDLKSDGDSLSFEFDSYADFDIYFLELLENFNEFFPEDKQILMHYTHNWWPLLYPLKEKRAMDKLKSDFFCFCRSDTPIDRYCSNFENDIGLKVLHSTDPKINWNVNIMGDLIFTFYSDSENHSEIGKYFDRNKDMKDLDLRELISLLEKKGRFRVVVLRDSKFAKNVLEEVKLFNKKVK
jgi:hypothetical protein